MNNGPQITALSPARYRLVSSALVWLAAAALFVAFVPGCVLFDPTDPYAEMSRRVLCEYGLARGPTVSSTSRPTTQAVEVPITLAKAVEIALGNNPGLAAAGHGVDADRKSVV